MKLSASIVTYHVDPDELRQALQCLGSSIVGKVWVIDNSSSPSTHAVCNDFTKVEYIPHENRGYGAAHNVALRRAIAAGSAYHLVLNSDICFDPDILARLVSVMDHMAGVGQLQPRIVNTDGSMQWTVRRLPTLLDMFGRRFLPKALTRRRNARYELHHIDHSRPFNVPYHQGSFMLLRCDALRRVGLFDERFFMYPEDIDLTRRIHEHYVTLYWPHETVVHAHRAASYQSLRMSRIHIVNMLRYFAKWGFFFDRRRRRTNRLLDCAATYVAEPANISHTL